MAAGTDMENMSIRAMILQAHQAVYDEMPMEFEAMGTDGRYCRRQKDYALKIIDEYGVRAVARILGLPRRTLQRWCRKQSKRVQRCPGWVYSWAAKRQKRREFWTRNT
jgi:DNA invertase Pin-like site-specific DNA recombinase